MKFKNHLIGSAISAVGLIGLAYAMEAELSTKEMVLTASAVIVGGNFPDFDLASIPSRMYAIVLALTLPVFYYLDMPWHWVVMVIPFVAAKTSKHRGISHSYLLVLILLSSSQTISFASPFLPNSWLWVKDFIVKFSLQIDALAVGLVTHYVLDKMSPFKRKNWF